MELSIFILLFSYYVERLTDVIPLPSFSTFIGRTRVPEHSQALGV